MWWLCGRQRGDRIGSHGSPPAQLRRALAHSSRRQGMVHGKSEGDCRMRRGKQPASREGSADIPRQARAPQRPPQIILGAHAVRLSSNDSRTALTRATPCRPDLKSEGKEKGDRTGKKLIPATLGRWYFPARSLNGTRKHHAESRVSRKESKRVAYA